MHGNYPLNPTKTPAVASPTSAAILSSVPGIATVVRDMSHAVVSCNSAYADLHGQSITQLVGSTHRDRESHAVADERAALMFDVIHKGWPRDFLQFWEGRAWLCRLIPLDQAEFGTRGTLSVIMQAPIGTNLMDTSDIHVLRTANFGALKKLTPAEKRSIYDLSLGRSNSEIAEIQDRSVRTIECHVRAIHEKIGTSSRSAIIRDAAERGIQLFTACQWELMIGSNRSPRARRRPVLANAMIESKQ